MELENLAIDEDVNVGCRCHSSCDTGNLERPDYSNFRSCLQMLRE